mmetsp:Transcript_63324/g.88040  ORF Transcript_63324/g.88040 Transcript_63324/m.88040 type:complete len:223 (+) Transcript_63324:4138-4806(+)
MMPRMAWPQFHGSRIQSQIILCRGATQRHAQQILFFAVAFRNHIVDGSHVEARLGELGQGLAAQLRVHHFARDALHSSSQAVCDADGLPDGQNPGGIGRSDFAHRMADYQGGLLAPELPKVRVQNVQRHRDQRRVRGAVIAEVLLQENLQIDLPDVTQGLLHGRPRWAELQHGNVRVCTMGALAAEDEDAGFRSRLRKHLLQHLSQSRDLESHGHVAWEGQR